MRPLIGRQQRQQQLNTETNNDTYDYLPKHFGDNRPYFKFYYDETSGFCMSRDDPGVRKDPSNCVMEDRIQKWFRLPNDDWIAPVKPESTKQPDTNNDTTTNNNTSGVIIYDLPPIITPEEKLKPKKKFV